MLHACSEETAYGSLEEEDHDEHDVASGSARQQGGLMPVSENSSARDDGTGSHVNMASTVLFSCSVNQNLDISCFYNVAWRTYNVH